MTIHNQEIDQVLHAAIGLSGSAGASALRNVSQLIREQGTLPALDQIAVLTSLSERVQSCINVATQAEADGDAELAELGWQQALSLMNHMAEQTTGLEMPATMDEQLQPKQAAGWAH